MHEKQKSRLRNFIAYVVCPPVALIAFLILVNSDSTSEPARPEVPEWERPMATKRAQESRQVSDCEDQALEYLEQLVKDRLDGVKITKKFIGPPFPDGDRDAFIYYELNGEDEVFITRYLPQACLVLTPQ